MPWSARRSANVGRIAANFDGRTDVAFPTVVAELSTQRVLVTHYEAGCKITDKAGVIAEIRAIVETGQLTNEDAEAYLVDVLQERRNKIGQRYLFHGGGLDRFDVTGGDTTAFVYVAYYHMTRSGRAETLPSVVAEIDAATGHLRRGFRLTGRLGHSHVGGIAYAAGALYVSSAGWLERYPLPAYDPDGPALLDLAADVDGTMQTGSKASFVSAHRDTLWVGDYRTNSDPAPYLFGYPLGPDGRLVRAFRPPDVGHVDRLVPIGRGEAMLTGMDPTLHVIDEEGRLLRTVAHPYASYGTLHPISAYNRAVHDRAADSTAFFFYYGGGFARTDRTLASVAMLTSYVENIPFPEVTVQRTENADGSVTTSSSVNASRLAVKSGSADEGVLYLLFQGDTEYGNRLVDRYSIGSGEYLGSWLLPDSARAIAVAGELVATLVENPYPAMVVRRAPEE